MRKINAYLSMVTIVMLFAHLFGASLLLLGMIEFTPVITTVIHIFVRLFFAHAILSVFIFFFNMEDKDKGKLYIKKNIITIIQRMTAILLMIFIHQHMGAYTTHLPDGQVIMTTKSAGLFATEFLWVTLVCIHSSVSIPKALITIGAVGTPKAYKTAQVISAITVGILWLVAVYAIVSYFLIRG